VKNVKGFQVFRMLIVLFAVCYFTGILVLILNTNTGNNTTSSNDTNIGNNQPAEKEVGQEAIELVQQYKVTEKSASILKNMAEIFVAAELSGTKETVVGWSAKLYRDNIYYVDFKYYEKHEDGEKLITFKFAINMTTRKVTGINQLGKKFIEMCKWWSENHTVTP
jgi:hypothetical protein